MIKCFQSRAIYHFVALLGCAYLSACNATGVKQTESTQTPTASPIADVSPQVQKSKDDRYAKLNSEFLAKLKQVSDPNKRMYYEAGIHYLHRLAQEHPENRKILEKLVQHQVQTLEIFQICDKNEFTRFDWITLYHSLFWERADNSYLVLLICSTGTSNRQFVPFLYSEANGKAKLKPLKLTRFRRMKDGTVQRVAPEVAIGRTFPNSDQWFNPVTEELRIWTRLGGGAEACGTKGAYRLQNDEFVLQEFTARWECDPTKEDDYEKLYP